MKCVWFTLATTLLTSSVLMVVEVEPSKASGHIQNGEQAERYSLLATTADLPAGFQKIFLHDHTNQHLTLQFCYGDMTRRQDLNQWLLTSQTKHPSEETIAKVLSKKTLDISIKICPDPSLARTEFLKGRSTSAVPMNPGSWSGRKIGDVCYTTPTTPGTKRARSFTLAALRGRIYFYIHYLGDASDEYLASEKLASTLCDRIDAVSVLIQASESSILVAAKEIKSRKAGEANMVLLSDYEKLTGAVQKTDFATGDVCLKNKGHSLRLTIGQKAALLDGKPFILAFPALRWGHDEVYCPIEILKAIGVAEQAKK